MVDGDCAFMIDIAAVFFDYFRVEGWFHSAADELAEVQLQNTILIEAPGAIGLPHLGVAEAFGPGKGFCIQALLDKSQRTPELSLIFRTRNGRTMTARIVDLCDERKAAFAGRAVRRRFSDMINADENTRLLDIGGRARSGVDYSKMFQAAKCTVLDVLPGENVDVVGDAHEMSKLFAPGSFDAIFSTSVFEHLLMPWVVAVEMSKLLRPGGIAFIATHQTLGMHDMPWDFWRFSDTAWDGLFNRLTGFEIIDRALENPQFITPHFWSPEQGDHLEAAVGFVGSSVLVRKIAEPQLQWGPLAVSNVIETIYPDTEEPVPDWHANPEMRWST
jgi:SAM-dependent methyltransferase